MARPKFKATQAMRERVRSYAAIGLKHDDISKIIGCSAKTLRLHFRNELDRAAIEANANVAGKLYQTAMTGNVAAMMFWLRARAGWKDSTTHAPSLPDPRQAPPLAPDNVVIVLPANKRFDDPRTITEAEYKRRFGHSPFEHDSAPAPLCLPGQGNGVVEEPDEGE